MTVQVASLPSRSLRRSFDRSRLLVGVSLLALLGSVGKVDARALGGAGESAVGNPAAIAAAAAAASAQQSSAAGQQAIQSMARAAQSLQGMRDAQSAARAAALAASGGVPNGLTAGGLVVAPGAGTAPGVWVGAGAPAQAQANGRTQVEIRQTEQKAILNWSSFNVGRETDVYFNQTAGGADKANWIALNRVTDPSLAPSRILGTIKAEGQVYVINKNGIVFGGASQINVNSFVASSLSLSDEQFRAGINKQLLIFDDPSGASIAKPQFGYLGQEKPNPYIGLNAPGQVAGVAIGDAPGDVRIEAGAQLTMASGGKALVFAPHVVNSGRISATDGQVILAAGEQVYLATDQSGIRGLEVAVSAPMRWVFNYFQMDRWANSTPGSFGAYQDGLNAIVFPEMAARAASVGYSVVNNGMVKADHGNITLISRTIAQNGALEVSTALNNRDGSIRLRAWENGMLSYGGDVPPGSLRYWSAGSLTLGAGSVTTSMPDLTDTSEIEQTSLATRYMAGRIEMRGKLIDIEARASVIVPTGTISIVASTSTLSGETPIVGEPVKRDGSRVYIGEDAYLSVAGLQDMLLTMESNTVTGELRINELRDSPLYRDSWLRSKTVSVDKRVAGLFTDGPMSDVQWIAGSPGAWVGTPIGDFSGWVGVGKTTLGELSANAGKASIIIKSSGSIITRQGSLLDVAGGSVRYQDGYITTTKLLGANGRIYDIGEAMPDQLYVGLAGSFARTHNVQGKIDPRLTETWSSILDRNTSRRFEPGYTEGRAAGAIQFFAAEAMVLEGSYWGGVITGERQASSGKLATAGSFTIGGGSDEHRQWLIGNLIIDDQPKLLPTGFTSKSVLDPSWYVTLPASDPSVRQKTTYLDSDILADSGMAKFTFMVSTGFTLAKDEKLELAAGTSFNVFANVSALNPAKFTVDGSIRIAGGSVWLGGTQTSTYGATADIDVSGEWFNGPRSGLPPVIKGGSINVSGDFAPGVMLDVSGGGWYDTTGLKPKLKLGDAGALIIAPTGTAQLAGLDVRGYSAASGGTIAIVTTGSIRIGGAASANPATGWLAETLFADRGFRGFDLTTTGDVIVADGAIISQLPLSVDLSHVHLAAVPSGTGISDIGPLTVAPLFERVAHKPTSLRLAGANVVIGAGAAVKTDVLGSISLAATGNPGTTGTSVSGNLTIRGTLEAPAGAISLSAQGDVKLAASAKILARGIAVVESDTNDVRTGSVLAGGSVSVDTSATMTLEKESLIDVSGASGAFDLDRGRNGAEAYTLASNGGSISLKFSGEAKDVVDATLLAQAGGAGASGGNLNISVASVSKPGNSYSLPYTLYYRDRRDGVIKMLDLNEGYYLDLDIYHEYSSGGDLAFEFYTVLSQIEQAVGLNRTGGLAFVNLKSDTSPATVDQPLALIMPRLIDQLDLLSRHFYVDAAATIPVLRELPLVNVKMTKVSADAVNGGGFGTLTTNSSVLMVAPGVDLAVGKSISIGSPIVSGGAGAASITAPYIKILAGNGMAGAAGSGRLTVTADLIDVTRATFSGFAETRLVTGDLRIGALIGGIDGTEDRRSYLTADGQLTLKAAQIYPATGMVASIKAGTQLDIQGNGDNGLPLSAAGTLKLQAPVIVQGGVVRAPFGRITLTATDSITLGAGSITSVSGDGLLLPYGTLSNNEFWNGPAVTMSLDQPTPPLGRLPENNIVLQGPKVTLATGSVVDIRGGGDLFAWEHVPGPGGSHDVLAQPGMYAIMPGLNASAASQQKVWLAGGNGLAAGWYALLPARYALLPGAFAVSMVKGSASARMPNTMTMTMADGSTTMAGRLADSHGGGFDQLLSSWRVMSGTTLRSYSEYNEAYANTYFASDAFKLGQYRLTGVDVVTPRMPIDGGAVVFEATSSLVLDGTLQSQPALGGRGGLVDISGSKIAIVGAGMDRSDLAGYLVIDATSLSHFGAGSLLIGGVRSGDARGLKIDVAASDVLVRNDAASSLTGPEILLAAIGEVRVAEGSVIVAAGHSPGRGADLVVAPRFAAVYGDADGHNDYDPRNDVLITPARDYGALIRVSVSDAVNVLRENVDTSTGGVITIGANATLSGGNALLLDATRNTVVTGSARLSGAAMSLASGRIGFGGGTSGLVLDAASLAQLANTQALTLRSYSTMDFYTSVNLGGAGLDRVVFDAAGLVGYGNGAIDVSGKSIALQNSGGTPGNPGAAGTVRLSLNADEIVLGSGAKVLHGFDTVMLNAGRQITGQGNGSIDAGTAAVTLVSPVVTGRGGASQSLTTQNTVRILAGGGASLDNPEASLGARLNFTGTSVELGGRIVALGGAVNLTSTAGDVVIGQGGAIDVGGFRKQFFDVAQYADAGSIALTAAGSVIMAPGGTFNLSAHAEGGAAGKLSLASNGGTVVLGGRIEAHAAAGQAGGSFVLDIAALPDFAAQSQLLNAAGFSASRAFRIRSGDVVVDGLTQVADFSLVADQGSVTLAGTIDARSGYGGRISVSAGNGLTMLGSALLQAGATGEFGGGRVTLEASGGQLDIRGGTIDVAGGEGGRVRFRALQEAGHDEIKVANLQVGIVGSGSSVLEGVSVYNSGSVDAVRGDAITGAIADANTFLANAAAIAARLNANTSGVAVMPGIEIRSTGDLVAATDWNLAADFAAARMGSLTLRAGGNLVILGNISDGFSSAALSGMLQNMASWDLRLIAGADLTSASALAVKPLAALAANSGTISVGNTTSGNVVRTGTGDIDIAAGRDLLLAHNTSAIYTAGRADQAVYADFVTPTGATYGIGGGNLRVAAQGSATSVLPSDPDDNQLFMEWLKKVGSLDANFVFETDRQSSWWIDYSMFQQGVGALGGGNVSVKTGGDLVNMLVALPTNGRVRGGRSSGEAMLLEMRNGGLMQVEASGAVRAGYYYVGRGEGVINAGEFANGRTVSATLKAGTVVYNIAPVLALGDAAMTVKTAGDLVLQTVMDPLLLNSDTSYFSGGTDRYSAYMSGYTGRTSLELLSVGGSVSLTNQGRFLSKQLDISSGNGGPDMNYSMIGLLATNLYPSVTRIAALNGSVTNQNRLFTVPGANSEFRILAEKDVVLGEITLSRANLDMMPTPLRPYGGVSSAALQLNFGLTEDFQNLRYSGFAALLLNQLENGYNISVSGALLSYSQSVRNPQRLVNEADMEPSRIFARSGSIVGSLVDTEMGPTLGKVTTNEQTWFRAGTDIRNIDYNLRNLHRTDVSVLEAGTDIIGGNVDIQGPGAILLAAGRDVYGATFQIFSAGNFDKYDGSTLEATDRVRAVALSEVRGLAKDGASISVMAGLKGKQPTYDALAAMYLDPANLASMPDYLKGYSTGGVLMPLHWLDLYETRNGKQHLLQTGMAHFVYDMTGQNATPADVWDRFKALPVLTQQRFLRQVYFNELRAAGDNQTTRDADDRPLNGGYQRGYTAIEALFPGQAWSGNIQIGNSTFRTMAGGGVETLTPGGGLQVAALGTMVPDGAGLVTFGGGGINIFARDNVTVNRSRILTFAGGDEVIWSTLGDIDAGRGSKTTRVPSAPDITTNVDAVTEVQERPDIGGSGIGTVIGFGGVEEGDVTMVAPHGTVDPGDAGIRVSGNFTVAAMIVLNAENIKVGGESKGVPKAESAPISLNVETKDKAAADAIKDATQTKASERPSVIIVEVLGYGGGGNDTQQQEKDERRDRNEQRSYNTNSLIQLVGNGSLNQDQNQALTEDEKRRLREMGNNARPR